MKLDITSLIKDKKCQYYLAYYYHKENTTLLISSPDYDNYNSGRLPYPKFLLAKQAPKTSNIDLSGIQSVPFPVLKNASYERLYVFYWKQFAVFYTQYYFYWIDLFKLSDTQKADWHSTEVKFPLSLLSSCQFIGTLNSSKSEYPLLFNIKQIDTLYHLYCKIDEKTIVAKQESRSLIMSHQWHQPQPRSRSINKTPFFFFSDHHQALLRVVINTKIDTTCVKSIFVDSLIFELKAIEDKDNNVSDVFLLEHGNIQSYTYWGETKDSCYFKARTQNAAAKDVFIIFNFAFKTLHFFYINPKTQVPILEEVAPLKTSDIQAKDKRSNTLNIIKYGNEYVLLDKLNGLVLPMVTFFFKFLKPYYYPHGKPYPKKERKKLILKRYVNPLALLVSGYIRKKFKNTIQVIVHLVGSFTYDDILDITPVSQVMRIAYPEDNSLNTNIPQLIMMHPTLLTWG